jgi:hypothetical protein
MKPKKAKSRGSPPKVINEQTKVGLGLGLTVLGMSTGGAVYLTHTLDKIQTEREITQVLASCSSQTTPIEINISTPATEPTQEMMAKKRASESTKKANP